MDLRLGRYQDALADVECDALICDPPYSERTHKGHDAGTESASDRFSGRRPLDYSAWGATEVAAFVDFWKHRNRGWWVVFSDHVLAPVWESELARIGLYGFAPLPVYSPGMTVRISGDGPASWTSWITVARPKSVTYSRWGSLPGGYSFAQDSKSSKNPAQRVGGKPLALMRALVSDYSRPCDLVCDPVSGYGTTAVACQCEGRRFIGAEMDAEAHAIATDRLKARMDRTPDQPALALEGVANRGIARSLTE